jgi:hypothetical protein
MVQVMLFHGCYNRPLPSDHSEHGSLQTSGSSHSSNNGSYGVLSFHLAEKEPHHRTGHQSKWKVAIIAAVLSSPKHQLYIAVITVYACDSIRVVLVSL